MCFSKNKAQIYSYWVEIETRLPAYFKFRAGRLKLRLKWIFLLKKSKRQFECIHFRLKAEMKKYREQFNLIKASPYNPN
ncbi:MAG: hypothetical protein CMC70_00290 [Flavobacteriaceae bacterium]|nr:hypothetical protein [Flavobacteriaceae bacterium]